MPDGGSGGSGSGSDGGGTSTGDPSPFPSDPAGGEFAWVVSSDGARGLVSVAADQDGNIVVAATQTGEVVLGSLHLATPHDQALLVLKLTSDGTPVWARSFPVAGSVTANGITATSEGDVVIGGQFYGGALQVGDQQMTAVGLGDGFVIALDGASGAPRWAAQLGSSSDDVYPDLVASVAAGRDADGTEAIYAYGQLGGVYTIDDGVPFPFSFTTAFLIRYDRDGTQRWAKSFRDMDGGLPHTLALDPHRGPVITGYASSTLTFGDQVADHASVVVGLDFDGQVRFARSITSDFQSFSGNLGVASGGDVYFASEFQGTPLVVDDQFVTVIPVDLDLLASPFDLFLLRFTSGGRVAFSRMIRSPRSASSIAVVNDAAGASYLLGTCDGEIDVQPEIQCDATIGGGKIVVSHDAGNAYRWATFAQPVDADLAAAPGSRLVMAGVALAPEVNFGGIRVPTHSLFIASLGAGPARIPSPLPTAPTISRVALDGASDMQIRQGGAGTLVVAGTALDQVTAARLGALDIHVPAHTATATELRLPVTIPHGHTAGPLTLTLSNASGSALLSGVVTVTPIVVGPTGSTVGRGTFSSPLPLCNAMATDVSYGDVVQLLDGTYGCREAFFVPVGVVIRGTSEAGTVLQGVGLALDPALGPDPFGTTVIENLTIDGASISSLGATLTVADVTIHQDPGSNPFSASLSLQGGHLAATNIDIDGGGIGIEVTGNGSATVDGYRFLGGHGTAIDVAFSQLDARHVTVDASVGIILEDGTLALADSEISTGGVALDAGDENTPAGTRTVTLMNTRLRSTSVAITEVTTQLTVTDCTLERGPEAVGGIVDGIRVFGGTLTFTRTVLRGFEAAGFALWDAPPFVTAPNITLDQVDIEVGDTGIEEIEYQDHGHLSVRNSHVNGQRRGFSLLGGFATVDLGTADSPGNNQIETASGGLSFEDWGDSGVVDAHGTTLNGTSYDGDVQGPASVAGAYTLHGSDTIRF